MINARAETAAVKPAFREALGSRRCLIPADGFYEWQRSGKTKQPYCFEVGSRDINSPHDSPCLLVQKFSQGGNLPGARLSISLGTRG
jgi:hypothetical protein